VRSDAARPITLTWEVVAPMGNTVLARSRLQDLSAGGAPVAPLPGGSYSVTMVGTVHQFRWQVLVRADVALAGSGAGRVTSDPPGVDCGADCREDFPFNTGVTLSADPDAGSEFAGWSGACSGSGPCVLQMDVARAVTASFTAMRTLTVSRSGSGLGSVVSTDPAGLVDCGSTCVAVVPDGTEVTLEATAAAGSDFTGWSGACSGTGPCSVLMDANRAVDAGFAFTRADLTITKDDRAAVVAPGQALEYTVVVAHDAASTVVGARVLDPVTAVADLDPATVSWSCVGTLGGSCSAGGAGDVDDLVTLPPGSTVTYTVDAVVVAEPVGDTVSNTASVTPPAGLTDPDPGNNSATDDDRIRCGYGATLEPGLWRQVGLPCDPDQPGTLVSLFGDDGLGAYPTDWRVYRWDPAAGGGQGAYFVVGYDDEPLARGTGYWVKSLDGGAVDLLGSCGGPAGGFELPLQAVGGGETYTMLGHPYDATVAWGDVEVWYGEPATAHTLLEAHAAGVMSKVMWKWDPHSAYQAFAPDNPVQPGSLSPFDGFWVRVLDGAPNLHLTVPAGSTRHSTVAEGATSGPWGWYVRLVADSGDMVDRGNGLGVHGGARDGPDGLDLEELPPIGGDSLTVVFPHPDWGRNAGDYTVDFRGTGARAQEWRLEVRTSRPKAEVTLSWAGPSWVLRQSALVDPVAGRTIPAGVPAWSGEGRYTFTVVGGRRELVWRFAGAGDPGPRFGGGDAW
jgi:hypothetical protein